MPLQIAQRPKKSPGQGYLPLLRPEQDGGHGRQSPSSPELPTRRRPRSSPEGPPLGPPTSVRDPPESKTGPPRTLTSNRGRGFRTGHGNHGGNGRVQMTYTRVLGKGHSVLYSGQDVLTPLLPSSVFFCPRGETRGTCRPGTPVVPQTRHGLGSRVVPPHEPVSLYSGNPPPRPDCTLSESCQLYFLCA